MLGLGLHLGVAHCLLAALLLYSLLCIYVEGP